jgi:uncharacterized membrane protein (DUF106 family)
MQDPSRPEQDEQQLQQLQQPQEMCASEKAMAFIKENLLLLIVIILIIAGLIWYFYFRKRAGSSASVLEKVVPDVTVTPTQGSVGSQGSQGLSQSKASGGSRIDVRKNRIM